MLFQESKVLRMEFDSLINIRPAQGNRSRGVEDKHIQQKIKDLMAKWIRE